MQKIYSSDLSERLSLNIRIICIIFSILLSSICSQAQKISGQFLLSSTKVQGQIQDQILKLKPINGVYSEQNGNPIVIPGALPVTLNLVSYTVTWQDSAFSSFSDQNLQYLIKNVELKVIIPELKIDTIVVRVVNGITLNIKIKSTCQNIQLNGRLESLLATAGIADDQKNAELHLISSIKDVQLAAPQISIGDFKCDNITGFEDVVSQEILKQTAQIDFIKPALIGKLTTAINEQLDQVSTSINQTLKQQLTNTALPLDLKIKFKNMNANAVSVMFAVNNPDALNIDLPNVSFKDQVDSTMVVDKSEFQIFLKELLVLRLGRESISSKSISALDKLTKSRFQQFFVWPALLDRPKGAELILKPTVEAVNFTIKPNQLVQTLQVNATAGFWVIDRNEPMVYFRSLAAGVSNIFDIGENLKTVLSSLKTSAIWDANYLKNKDVSKHISTSILDSVAKQYFTDNWANQNLNLIQLTDQTSAKVKNIYLDETNKLYFNLNMN